MKRAILNEQYLNGYIINENAPIGTIQQFAKTCPNGSVNCNGQSLSRTNYNRLFAIIGTTYGADNEDTFKVPLITDKALLNVEYMTGERYINGKPLYQKIIDVRNNGVGVTGFSINVSDLNIDYLVDSNALGSSYNNYGGNKWVLSCVTSSGTRDLYLEGATQNLRGKSNEYIHFASIEYTKTTDTENTFCYNQLAGSNFCIKATDYTQATEDILNDNKVTTGNVWSAAKTKAEIDARHKYSTEEKVIGEWIDGKPIYRNVLSIPQKDYMNWQFIDATDSLNIDKVLNAVMYGTDSEGHTDCTCYALVRRYSNNKLAFITSGYALYGETLVLEYTKTTD